MKNLLTPCRTVALPLLVACSCASAQSLGRPVAEPWIGQPLQVTVPARFYASEAGDECVHADVFYGEQRISSNLVRASVSGPGPERQVRIDVDAPVNEPVVTLSLRAGCRGPVTRNYTLLADMPSEQVLASLGRPATPSLARAESPRLAAAAGATPSLARRLLTAQRGATPPAAAAPVVAARARPLAQAPAGGSRLRLDVIEPDAHTLLRASAQLSDPAGHPSRRAAAALLWQAINADPQEVLRTSVMLRHVETEVAQLRRSAGLNQNEITALRQRMDEAQPWYASAAAVQVLALLVLSAAAAAGVLWLRGRRLGSVPPWYAAAPGPAQDAPLRPLAAAGEATARRRPSVDASTSTSTSTDRRTAREAARATASGLPSAPARIEPAGLDLVLDGAAPPRAGSGLRVETLAATFEEVEFLASLGLVTDACDVLKGYLEDTTTPSPLAFFELLRLCERQDDHAAVAAVRRRYARVYGAEAPRLDQMTAPVGVEGTPALSARVTAAWGTPQALEMIEETLFARPLPGSPLTLQAGRDLLCLYDLAVALATEDAMQRSDAAHDVPLAPWAHAEDVHGVLAAVQAAADANGGDRFALDVDLGAAPAMLPASRPEPALDVALAALAPAPAAAPPVQDAEDAAEAFSAAVAGERVPVSRY